MLKETRYKEKKLIYYILHEYVFQNKNTLTLDYTMNFKYIHTDITLS